MNSIERDFHSNIEFPLEENFLVATAATTGGDGGCTPKNTIIEALGNLIGELARQSNTTQVELRQILTDTPDGQSINLGQLRNKANEVKSKAQSTINEIHRLRNEYSQCHDDEPPQDFIQAENFALTLIREIDDQLKEAEQRVNDTTFEFDTNAFFENLLNTLEGIELPFFLRNFPNPFHRLG
jgi:uncharacterized protein YpuA (DUF1002 family)